MPRYKFVLLCLCHLTYKTPHLELGIGNWNWELELGIGIGIPTLQGALVLKVSSSKIGISVIIESVGGPCCDYLV